MGLCVGGLKRICVISWERIRVYISNKSEESKMFETIRVDPLHKIYIIYVAFNIEEHQRQAKRLKYIREL